MENTNTSALEQLRNEPGIWQEILQQVRLIYHLMRDPEVPLILKVIPFLGILYLISPIDLIPGAVVPVIGGLDDVTALLVAAKVFIDLTPPHVVDKYVAMMRGDDFVPMSDKEAQTWEDAIVIDADHSPTDKADSE